jgi:dTDP-4-dehydrorhamnose 3,5-epimerase
MNLEPLNVSGCYVIRNEVHNDTRGKLSESWKLSEIHTIPGWEIFNPVQQNFVESSKNTIRGIHLTKRSYPQFKVLTVNDGIIKDVVVDLRLNSKTYGSYSEVILDARNFETLLICEGIGHAYQTLSTKSLVTYSFSAQYSPGNEITINPLDSELDITWDLPFILSDKDCSAPQLREINLDLL